jgi:hypothetical protein
MQLQRRHPHHWRPQQQQARAVGPEQVLRSGTANWTCPCWQLAHQAAPLLRMIGQPGRASGHHGEQLEGCEQPCQHQCNAVMYS